MTGDRKTLTDRVYDALHERWVDAWREYRRTERDDDSDAEQTAWDALVDYVEANDLNDTDKDPRTDKHREWVGTL